MNKANFNVLIGYPPIKSEKGIPLLSQNRQFQYFNNPTFIFPVVLGTAATMLKKEGYNILWRDFIAEGLSEDFFFEYLEFEKPNLIVFETKTPVIKLHWMLINKLKERFPDMKIAICGYHVTFLPEETLQNSKVDYVIVGGYFDFAILDLCNSITKNKKVPEGIWHRKDGLIINKGRYEFKGKLDDAQFIDRELTKNELYQKEYNLKGRPFAYIMSARDCWWNRCRFCVWNHTLYPKGSFRSRTPENVFEEVKLLVDQYGIKEIFDDAGTISTGDWLKKLCELMIESGYNKKVMYSCNMRFGAVNEEEYKLMKKAGFRLLKFGLESGNQKTLDRLDKGIKIIDIEEGCKLAKKAKLLVHLTMMVGYNFETREDANNTLKLAKKLMTKGYADVLQSTVIVPYPGTPLYEEALKENAFRIDPKDYERYDMSEPVLKTPDMTSKEIMDMCNNIYKIFLTPEYMFRRLIGIRSFGDVKFVLKGAKAVLGHLKDFSRGKDEAY